MQFIPIFTGFYTSQVVVWDFFQSTVSCPTSAQETVSVPELEDVRSLKATLFGREKKTEGWLETLFSTCLLLGVSERYGWMQKTVNKKMLKRGDFSKFPELSMVWVRGPHQQ